jgi:hypothetical protein
MAIEDQPPPTPQPDREPVWNLVIGDVRAMLLGVGNEPPPGMISSDALAAIMTAEMAERDETGRQRYGTPLTTHNGRDHLVDAYQEALDLAVYLRAYIAEHRLDSSGHPICQVYVDHLGNLARLRHLMWLRDHPPTISTAQLKLV